MGDKPPTSAQIRRFFNLLTLAHFDCTLESANTVHYYLDADVAVRIVAGFEEEPIGSPSEQLFRALLACGQVGPFRIVRPHALELYEYIARKQRDISYDQGYRDRANAYIANAGIDTFIEDLRTLAIRYDSSTDDQREECVKGFVKILRTAGAEKFVAIEAVRAPWRRRLKSFYYDVLKLDSLGPEMPQRQSADFANDDMILRFLQRQAGERRYGSNYRDACALAILAGQVRARHANGEGPLVRLYSETAVVRAACTDSADLARIFDERSSIGTSTVDLGAAQNYGIFRDSDYFLMRVIFPEVGFSTPRHPDKVEALIKEVSAIGLEKLKEPDLGQALQDLDRQHVEGIGGRSLAAAIEEFEDLRLVRAVWAREVLPAEAFKHLGDWTQVASFAQGVTKDLLDETIDDIQRTLRTQVSRLQGWFAALDRIHRVLSDRRGGRLRLQSPGAAAGIIEDPVRDIGVSRWGVVLSVEDQKLTSDIIRELHDPDFWQEACRNFASHVQRARTVEREARVVCSVLWLLGEYRWIHELLEALLHRRKNAPPPDLIVWRAAAWIRSTTDLAARPGKTAVRECSRHIDEVRDSIAQNRAISSNPLLGIGLAYLLYHCWKRVGPAAYGEDQSLQAQHRSWVEESLDLADAARRALPQHTLGWGLAVNHCVYVGMEAGREVPWIMERMRELAVLQAYGNWTARFADTAACYYMWRCEDEMRGAPLVTPETLQELRDFIDRAEEFLHDAQSRSIGDIAVHEHQIRWDRLRVALRKLKAEPS
jgi:hypothetical protein